ncbi:MAG: hypothetical protein ACRD5J_07320 [Nitrososphaeraceae archaeon]
MRIIQTSVDVVVKDIVHRSHSSDNKDHEKFVYKRIINFAICNSCYWSASCLKLDKSVVTCPNCGDDRSEFMPLTDTEVYTFDRDDRQGVIAEICNRSKKIMESLLS